MSGPAPRNPDFAARFAKFHADMYDGLSPVTQRVSVAVVGPELELTNTETRTTQVWRLDALRNLPDQAASDTLMLARSDDHPARLIIREAATAREILRAIPDLRPLRGSRGGWFRVGVMGLAAVGALAGILFGLVPVMADRGAMYVPPASEVALGQIVYDEIFAARGAVTCTATAGTVALDQMESRLMAGVSLPYPLTVRVVQDPLVNAFALPGGHIVIHSALIDAAETPEEVAAVLAHEIGHVAHRDGTRAVLRSVGSFGLIGLTMGDVFGGSVIAGLTRAALDSSYSRAAEEAADAYAITMLRNVGVSPGALATFFERMQASGQSMELGVFQHLSSHPDTLQRITAARAADIGQGRPILDAASWAALQGICADTTTAGDPQFAPNSTVAGAANK